MFENATMGSFVETNPDYAQLESRVSENVSVIQEAFAGFEKVKVQIEGGISKDVGVGVVNQNGEVARSEDAVFQMDREISESVEVIQNDAESFAVFEEVKDQVEERISKDIGVGVANNNEEVGKLEEAAFRMNGETSESVEVIQNDTENFAVFEEVKVLMEERILKDLVLELPIIMKKL
jgi:hypothetical protein